MNWQLDPDTHAAATAVPLPIQANLPAAQFHGRNFHAPTWGNKVINGAWPAPNFVAGPMEIINAFAGGNDLEALAMVVSWGTMWRTAKSIYGGRPLADIAAKIAGARASIVATNSIGGAWVLLTAAPPAGLGWSQVISSKTLHFLCRSLGVVNDPPVAIDNAVILQRVWPAWGAMIHHPHIVPGDWRGSDLAAYLRYMTAILTWANARGWTTTQLECTIFAEYCKRPAEVLHVMHCC